MIKQILSEELHDMLQKEQKITLIDVRETGEYNAGRLANSIHIPLDKLNEYLSKNPMEKNATYVIVCKAGVRSLNAAQIMKRQGYHHIINLEDGLAGWVHNGFEIEQD